MSGRAGLISLKLNGIQYDVKANITYNLGGRKHTSLGGADRNHGYKTSTIIPFVDCEITDDRDLDYAAIKKMTNETITITIENGKILTWKEMYYAADGDGGTEEANLQFRWESKKDGTEI